MQSALNKIIVFSLGAAAAGFVVKESFYTVDGGQRALIFDRFSGVHDKIYGEGIHFLIPWLQEPKIYDIRIKPKSIRSETGSKDLQTVHITLRVLFRPDVSKLKNIFQTLGLRYDEKVLPSIGNEVLKAVVAQFDAGELITQRELVSLRIREGLINRAEDFGILLDDVSITHLGFSRDYMAAIEHKQVAQQMAERQKFIVERARQEKLAEVILAEGETEAARLITEAMLTGNEFLQLRRIEAAREIAATLARSPNVVYLPSTSNILMNMST